MTVNIKYVTYITLTFSAPLACPSFFHWHPVNMRHFWCNQFCFLTVRERTGPIKPSTTWRSLSVLVFCHMNFHLTCNASRTTYNHSLHVILLLFVLCWNDGVFQLLSWNMKTMWWTSGSSTALHIHTGCQTSWMSSHGLCPSWGRKVRVWSSYVIYFEQFVCGIVFFREESCVFVFVF